MPDCFECSRSLGWLDPRTECRLCLIDSFCRRCIQTASCRTCTQIITISTASQADLETYSLKALLEYLRACRFPTDGYLEKADVARYIISHPFPSDLSHYRSWRAAKRPSTQTEESSNDNPFKRFFSSSNQSSSSQSNPFNFFSKSKTQTSSTPQQV